MEKIDRLGWADGICFSTYGARIGIRVNEPSVLARLPRHLPPHWKPVSSPIVDGIYSLVVGGNGHKVNSSVRRYNLLYAGAARIARTMDLDEVFDTLESSLHFNVAVGARRRLFVHAGVVGWKGRAIVIPGRSMSGKTTLVAALVKAGATYFSDEFAVFDKLGRVHPYSQPLHIREHQGRKKYAVEQLGGRAGTKPLPVGLIVVTEYRQGGQWRPRVFSPGEAVLAMIDHTVMVRRKPAMALQTLHQVTESAIALQSKRGEAEELAERLLDHLTAASTLSAIQFQSQANHRAL